MRLRSISIAVLAATMLAMLGPVGARADHCSWQLFLFTRVTARDSQTGEPISNPATGNPAGNPTVVPSVIGCDVLEEESVNTDYIYPGSNSFSVRWAHAELPAPHRSEVTFAGKTYDVDLENSATVTEDPVYDSDWIFFEDPLDTIDGGNAVVTVCIPDEEEIEICFTRSFRTVA